MCVIQRRGTAVTGDHRNTANCLSRDIGHTPTLIEQLSIYRQTSTKNPTRGVFPTPNPLRGKHMTFIFCTFQNDNASSSPRL